MDERPSLRAAPDAKPNAPLVYDDTDNKQIHSMKQQTDQSYLQDKWRPNRDDFQHESNDVSVKSSQTDTQSKMGQPVPSKPSQTDTSFLYDEYMRSRGQKKNQDSPSQTAMKPDPNAMGNIRYPTHYSPDRQDVPRSDQVSNASNAVSRPQSNQAMPTTQQMPTKPIMPSAIDMSRMERCECRQPVLMPCPSKSLPLLRHCDELNAFQSTCSKQSTQPSQDASVWYSLESENSNATCPASSKPSAPKSRPIMPEECICGATRDHFKSAQSSGYAPLDLDTDSNMRSAQSKSTKCSWKSSYVKSTHSSRSLPCGQQSRNAPVTVVYCPLRNYVNGPTTIDIEKGEVSHDATNWPSARSNDSNPCERSQHTCACSQATDPTVWNSARSDGTCPSNQSYNDISEASTIELTGLRGARTAPTPWQSVKSTKSEGSEAGNPNDPNLRFRGVESDDTNTVDTATAAATAWNSIRSNRSSLGGPSGQVITMNPSDPGFVTIESNREGDTAWNSTAPSTYSCGCQTSVPMHTPRAQTCPRSLRNSNAYTIVTSAKELEDSLVKTSHYTCGKTERPCTCGSSSRCPGSKSSNTDQTTSRSRSVMAKVTCLCSSEQRANLGDTNREDDGGPPFARVEESNLYADVSAADPNLVPAGGDDDQNNTSCYDPAQGSPTKVVFRADAFRDCRSSSATSLLCTTGSDSARGQTTKGSSTRVYCYDGESEQRISPSGSMKSAISCSCDKENTTEYKSARSDQGSPSQDPTMKSVISCLCGKNNLNAPPSNDPTMKSVITCLCGKDNLNDYKSALSGQTTRSLDPGMKSTHTCSCGKDTVHDYKSARSDRSPCSCKTSKYDFSMEELSEEPDTVGVVMSCRTPTVCVDKTTFDKLARGQSQHSARDRLLNMVNMVTSDRDPPMDRCELAQQIIRELTMMLRQDEEDSKQPKLSYEDCMEAVERGERPTKKSREKSPSEINRGQCLDRLEEYLQTCFPAKKTVEVKEIGGFEVDPDFDPFRKTTAVTEPEPEVPDIATFRSCFTDVETRFMTPSLPSAAELAASLKGDASGKIPSGDEAPGSSLGVGSEPPASPQQSEGPDAASPQLSVAPDGVSSVDGEPQGSKQLSVGADGTSLPVGGGERSTGTGSELKSPSMPSDGAEATMQPSGDSPHSNEGSTGKTGTSSGRPCDNEQCPEAEQQRQICEVDANDPLSPLTDRERLLCEYLLRRMCEMCEEDQEDEHYGDSEGGFGGSPSAPSQPCLCCHCRALVCDNRCKTVAKIVDGASYDPVAEMKFFIDSVVFDLQAMEHVMKKNLLTPSTAKPSPYMGNAPGESFPVTITDVSSLGCRALYVRWELQDCSGVGGYEIYVDGHLTNRFFSHRHEAGVVSNVDVNKRHQIILRATAIGQEFAGGDAGGGCKNAMMNAHPEMRVGAPQPWTPSVYFYEP